MAACRLCESIIQKLGSRRRRSHFAEIAVLFHEKTSNEENAATTARSSRTDRTEDEHQEEIEDFYDKLMKKIQRDDAERQIEAAQEQAQTPRLQGKTRTLPAPQGGRSYHDHVEEVRRATLLVEEDGALSGQVEETEAEAEPEDEEDDQEQNLEDVTTLKNSDKSIKITQARNLITKSFKSRSIASSLGNNLPEKRKSVKPTYLSIFISEKVKLSGPASKKRRVNAPKQENRKSSSLKKNVSQFEDKVIRKKEKTTAIVDKNDDDVIIEEEGNKDDEVEEEERNAIEKEVELNAIKEEEMDTVEEDEINADDKFESTLVKRPGPIKRGRPKKLKNKKNIKEERYECSICPEKRIIRNEDRFLSHTRRVHSSGHYSKCPHCPLRFKTRLFVKFREHVQAHNAPERPIYKCFYCDVEVNDIDDHRNHMETIHTEEELYTCKFCNEFFTDALKFKEHDVQHEDSKMFSCYNCSRTFPTYAARNSHLLRSCGVHHVCECCGHVYNSNIGYEEHILSRSNERNFACDQCDKRFNSLVRLKLHKQCHDEKVWPCGICGEKFCSKSRARVHEKVVHGEKKFSCTWCSFKTMYKNEIRRHMVVHTGEKPFHCKECDKYYSAKTSLDKHLRLKHTFVKRDTCRICGEKFETWELKQKHIRAVHNNGKHPHQCEYCSANYHFPKQLRDHLKSRHSDQVYPFICSLCDQRYSAEAELIEHVSNAHLDLLTVVEFTEVESY